MRVAFYTLGCKVNQYETQAMREQFLAQGFCETGFDSESDVYVINTCAVTAVSEKKSRQAINRARARNPCAVVMAVGCYSQSLPEQSPLPGADILCGTDRGTDYVALLRAFLDTRTPKRHLRDARSLKTMETSAISAFEGFTRANLKIQDGCNAYCSYCIIPFLRGPSRSKPLAAIRQEGLALLQKGHRELVLTGIHLSAYGGDLGLNLVDALRALDDFEGPYRLRLGSLDPWLITRDFVEGLSTIRHLCAQFHLSVQSGSADILRAMNRRYGPDEVLEAHARLKAAFPNALFTCDIITGFPGESEAMFEDSCRLAAQVGFFHCHVFPFSARAGTKAASLPGQLPRAVKQARAAALIAQSAASKQAILRAHIGKRLDILLERALEDGFYEGLSAEHLPVRLQADGLQAGCFYSVILTEAKEGYCIGTLDSKALL